jgi:hypothetical protein
MLFMKQCTLVMCGNSLTLVLGQSSSTNYIILDLSSNSEKVMKIMVLAKKSCRVQDFNLVCPNTK